MIQAEFGKYRIIAELGHGGMADVYLAVLRGPEGIHKLMVLKCLRPHLVEDHDFVTMLLDEARLAIRLNHPNVIQTNEVGKADGVGQASGQYFLAMEYLDGQPLHRIQNRGIKRGKLRPAIQYRIMAEVLAGLHYAHELTDYDGTPLNVVHRDATPQNVFITYNGHIKIVDFGIAKASRRMLQTTSGVIKGKVPYMAPEQARGGDVDRRADIFSVGVMLWEAATERRMWKGMDEFAIMQKLFTNDIPCSPREVNPDVPEEIERICARALAPDPADRYATAAEMQKDIDSFLRSTGEHLPNSEIGQFVAELFEDRKKEIKAIIEHQIANLEQETTSLQQKKSIAVVQLADPPSSTSTPASMNGTHASGFSTIPRVTTPPVDSDIIAQPSSWRRKALPAIALLAVVGVTVGIKLFASSGQPLAQTPAAVAEASSAAPAPPALMRIDIRATPSDAKLYLDGASLPTNPATSSLLRDGATRSIRAEAPGYVSANRLVRCDTSEMIIEFHLVPEPAAAVASSTAKTRPSTGRTGRWRNNVATPASPPSSLPQTTPPPPQPATTAAPASTPPPLDSDNPWSKDRSKLPTLEKENIWQK
jgi:eukaryotic-like serine/threonine-protein kinase